MKCSVFNFFPLYISQIRQKGYEMFRYEYCTGALVNIFSSANLKKMEEMDQCSWKLHTALCKKIILQFKKQQIHEPNVFLFCVFMCTSSASSITKFMYSSNPCKTKAMKENNTNKCHIKILISTS